MRGKARICVATCAFGLGINKSDVVGVVHMYLSSSPEHYLQEMGRAGRDGSPARAIALVLHDEVLVRHSLSHSDTISRSQIKLLVSLLSEGIKEALASPGHDSQQQPVINVALSLEKAISSCDCKAETIETLASLLELREEGRESLLHVQGITYDKATVVTTRRLLAELAAKEPVARAIIECGICTDAAAGEGNSKAQSKDRYRERSSQAQPKDQKPKLADHGYGSHAFSVARCANALGPDAEPRHVYAALRRLENAGELELALDTTARALHLKVPSASFRDENQVTNELCDRVSSTTTASANKVLDLNYILTQVKDTTANEPNKTPGEKSASLTMFQAMIQSYFEEEGRGSCLSVNPESLPKFSDIPAKHELIAHVRSVVTHLRDLRSALASSSSSPQDHPLLLGGVDEKDESEYLALAVTKFLHGITSACVPASLFRQHALFGRLQGVRFTTLHEQVSTLFNS
jgi:hypothetical protein